MPINRAGSVAGKFAANVLHRLSGQSFLRGENLIAGGDGINDENKNC